MNGMQAEETTTGNPSSLPADGEVERGVVHGALRALHPVHDAAAVGIGRRRRTRHATRGSRASRSYMVPQHQLLRMWLQVDLIEQVPHLMRRAWWAMSVTGTTSGTRPGR